MPFTFQLPSVSIKVESTDMEDIDQKPFICDKCYLVIDSDDKLNVPSDQCFQKSSRSLGERHSGTGTLKMDHAEEKPHKCDTCNSILETEQADREHKLTYSKSIVRLGMEDDMETENKLHVCSAYQVIFDSENLWRNHSINCSEKKPFVCEFCHMGFSGENELINHKDEHHDIEVMDTEVKAKHEPESEEAEGDECKSGAEKKFQCDLCKKSFRNQDKLQVHTRVPQVKGHTNATNVVNRLNNQPHCIFIRRYTVGRNHINVTSVKNRSSGRKILKDTQGYTLKTIRV